MVVINGSLTNIQSDLDFYLSITSKSLIADSREMKRRFFEIFKNEDLYREENFLMFQERVSDDYGIVEDAEPLLVGDEESYSMGNFSFGNYEEYSYNNTEYTDIASFNDDTDEYPDDLEVYNSNNILDDDEFISYGDTLDLENENITDLSFTNNLENERLSLDKENVIFDTEELVIEDENLYLENETDDLEDDEFIDYSCSENENMILENEKSNPFSSVDISSFSYTEYTQEEDLLVNKEEYEEEFSWGSYDDEVDIVDDIEDEYYSNKEGSNEETFPWGNFDDTEEVDFENTAIEEKPKNKVIEPKTIDIEDIKEVPSDLRDFVKLYHNCEISFALKYFTKKEIDKQLSLGRVFKRKNRLLI